MEFTKMEKLFLVTMLKTHIQEDLDLITFIQGNIENEAVIKVLAENINTCKALLEKVEGTDE